MVTLFLLSPPRARETFNSELVEQTVTVTLNAYDRRSDSRRHRCVLPLIFRGFSAGPNKSVSQRPNAVVLIGLAFGPRLVTYREYASSLVRHPASSF